MSTRALRFLAAAAIIAACKSTPEEAPSDSGTIVRDVPFADAGNTADTGSPTDTGGPTDTGSTADGSTPSDARGDARGDAAVDALVDAPGDAPGDALADSGAADVPSDVNCVGDGGCYACPPSTSAEIINRCTASTCARFDNRARLTRLLADGGVPPLP